MANLTLGIDEVMRGPILVIERAPDRIVVIDGNGISDFQIGDGFFHVVDLLLEQRIQARGRQRPTSPASLYFSAHARTYGIARRQLMQEYVQKSTTITLPFKVVGGQRLGVGATPPRQRTREIDPSTAKLPFGGCRAFHGRIFALIIIAELPPLIMASLPDIMALLPDIIIAELCVSPGRKRSRRFCSSDAVPEADSRVEKSGVEPERHGRDGGEHKNAKRAPRPLANTEQSVS